MRDTTKQRHDCPDCSALEAAAAPDRRDFLRTLGAASLATLGGGLFATPRAAAAPPTPNSAAETAVKGIYDLLTPDQKKVVCFAWDHQDKGRGLLRSHVSNNWHITKPSIDSDFFTKEQRHVIHDVFKGLFHPDWVTKIEKQLKDDTGGKPWGADQNIAIFGTPGAEKFMFVMTGRHLTVRADGNSEGHVAFGGPIFHGHAAQGFNEKKDHPGNVFWPQALLANDLYKMLDGKQQKVALIKEAPHEAQVNFRGPSGGFPGIPTSDLTRDQKEHLQKVLLSLIEPYRQEDRDEVKECLEKQGGLDKCHLSFYEEGDIGEDGVWDNWRLEGPSFVWYFRGSPHVHIWINVADDPGVKLNARG
jgi:hypothetical protein